MLYHITSLMTTNNYSTNLNDQLSMNDQYYSAQIYMDFIDHDYKDCAKNISRKTKNYEHQLMCYNTWYKNCMHFVRDTTICEIHRTSLQEYLYYHWLKNTSSADLLQSQSTHQYFLNSTVFKCSYTYVDRS